MENIIEVKNLIKRYKKAKENAVDNISFSVEEGSFFAFLGPNGAGKTTTISILNTTLSKTSGTVKIGSFDVAKNPSAVRQTIGVIFQNPSLDLNLTAEENVRFHANLYGVFYYRPTFSLMPKEYKEKIENLASILGLDMKDLFKPVKNLSGGMKRKLEIIRGLMHNPKVLFLDEPTTGLDPVSRKSLWNYLQKVRKQNNITIFLTTHYLEEAEGADKLCIINKGKIVAKGTPKEIKGKLLENYLEVDTQNNEDLEKEFREKDIDYYGKGPYKIKLNGMSIQHLIKRINTPLRDVQIHKPSLEDAYVEIIQGENEK